MSPVAARAAAPGARRVPAPGSIRTPRVATLPRPGSRPTAVVVRRRGAGAIPVERVRTRVPVAGSMALIPGDPTVRRTEFGTIAVADQVITGLASRAAAEHADAGGVARRVLGAQVPGLGRIGGRETGLHSLPKATGAVDGTTAVITLELAVRYPAVVADVTAAVRSTVLERLRVLAGVEVEELDIVVTALVTDLPARPRVR